jgi:hypothetical protein
MTNLIVASCTFVSLYLRTVSTLLVHYHAFLTIIHETGFTYAADKLNFGNDSQTNNLSVMNVSKSTLSPIFNNGLAANRVYQYLRKQRDWNLRRKLVDRRQTELEGRATFVYVLASYFLINSSYSYIFLYHLLLKFHVSLSYIPIPLFSYLSIHTFAFLPACLSFLPSI